MTVTDMMQPMLVSKAKKKDLQDGQEERLLYLLPELCTMTGITDDMRKNMSLMKDMGEHTRVVPNKRAAAMINFMGRLKSNRTSADRMAGWDVKFSDNLVSLSGRLLDPERIIIGKDQSQNNKTVSVISYIIFLYHMLVFPLPPSRSFCVKATADRIYCTRMS